MIILLVCVLLCFVGYNGFLFTESNRFCGLLCHVVMEPEYTAYQHSPHARVKCVECHVGPGTSFYVKSKLSGTHMVSRTILNNYTTPIPTPIKHLRPARETCEECHWPEKFYGAQLLQIPYFRYDEENTNDQISLIMKTGGGSSTLGQSDGIHWHMIVNNTITYATADPQQQNIPWFSVQGKHGEDARIHVSLDTDPDSGRDRMRCRAGDMDCIDCHNRPSHRFMPPDRSVDMALYNEHIPRDLPWVKKVAVEALETPYETRDKAREGIRDAIFNFYATEYAELYRSRSVEINQAVEMVLAIYDRTVFPEMNVDWTTYPMNIGHRNWPGCFRCHDGKHATPDGKVLSHECTICHTMPTRSELKPLGAMAPEASSDNWHPMLLTGKHANMQCTACHSRGVRPSPQCSNCHESEADTPMWEMACTDCHLEPGSLTPMEDCSSCHDELGGDHNAGGHPDLVCIDCHRPHHWTVEGRGICSECHDPGGFEDEHYAPDACTDCHEFV